MGFFCNLAVHHVSEKRYMSDEEVAAMQAKDDELDNVPLRASRVIGKGALLSPGALLAWALVMGPLAWGIWITVQKAVLLFQ